jgi:hypothetical protein
VRVFENSVLAVFRQKDAVKVEFTVATTAVADDQRVRIDDIGHARLTTAGRLLGRTERTQPAVNADFTFELFDGCSFNEWDVI